MKINFPFLTVITHLCLVLISCSSCSQDNDVFISSIVEEPLTPNIEIEIPNNNSESNNEEDSNTANQNNGEIIVNEGFENGKTAWESSGTFRGETNDAVIVGNARSGEHAVKFTANAGGVRSEFAIRNNGSNKYYEWGYEYWNAVSIKIVEPVGGYRIALQHHAIPENNPARWTDSAGSNSFTMTMTDTHLTFWTATDKNSVNDKPGSSSALGKKKGVSVPYQRSTWIDIVLHFKLTPDNTGYYEIWVNDNKILDIHDNPTVYLYDNGGGIKYPFDYSKIGIYYGNNDKRGEVHYDCFKIVKGKSSFEQMRPED